MTLVVASKRKMEKINYKARQCKFIYRALIHTYINSKCLQIKSRVLKKLIAIKLKELDKNREERERKEKKMT